MKLPLMYAREADEADSSKPTSYLIGRDRRELYLGVLLVPDQFPHRNADHMIDQKARGPPGRVSGGQKPLSHWHALVISGCYRFFQ